MTAFDNAFHFIFEEFVRSLGLNLLIVKIIILDINV